MSKWIKKDDNVYILAGNDKGRTGKVLARKDDRLWVEGINVRKKHVKQQGSQGSQPVNVEMPVHVSNAALCDKDGKKLKVKLKENSDGSRDLVYSDTDGKEVVYRSVRKKANNRV